ncbi:hypothetical protein LJR230_004836 [Trinickia sp. LjRoot230]|uniref:hypothetical protein n=1 Tax=Trinickia sp. LjRoot230 TaxID=3342288 RepID=UPI003ECE7FEE
MLMCYRTQRRVRAIRQGFDDRLLVFIGLDEPDIVIADASNQMNKWRCAYEDELELLAFMRLAQTDAISFHPSRQRAVARYLRAQGVPVAVGIDETNSLHAKANWQCDDDKHASLAIAASACADLALTNASNSDDCAVRTPFVIGCGAMADAAAQAALVAQTAQTIEYGEAHPCGLVIDLFSDSAATASGDDHPLLRRLATAVHQRRISCATRRFASLSGAL